MCKGCINVNVVERSQLPQYTQRKEMAECSTHGDHLVKLEEAFDLDEPEDYHILFKPMETSIVVLKEVVSDAEHIPSNTPTSQLANILTTELQPKLHVAHITINKMHMYFGAINSYTNTLRTVSCQANGTHLPNQHRETPWHHRKFNVQTGKWQLERMAEEWADFLNWVTCLPETQVWIQKGEDPREIALRWLKNFVVVDMRLSDLN
ncbi:hypothetical protein COCHEDRAFT_1150989 [Bipolaris maydis C5]|uniref:Uncharacterized protein n=1 Tax=Cochliobolus heterostrophus (strain C5 / ATCC 48332 / race O) TaxID=701091 RepID=M2UFY3_COCH5|nr:hypothetical protein COCHEDRAFT_1150989 [Bipolaris maydis C5]KAJ6214440.1 hypothetical protein PSV09DRAFT_1150989 [Bipolaris maydis]